MRWWTGLVVVIAVTGCAPRTLPSAATGLPRDLRLQEYAVPWENAFPSDAAVDTAGRVWFTDRMAHALGVFDPRTGEFRSYPTPTRPSAPYGLIAAPDGSLWFCESVAGRLGRVDSATGEITEYAIPEGRGGPHLLAWRDGAVWFTLRESRRFGRMDTRTGEFTLYGLERDRPYSVAVTRDAVWLSSFNAYRLLEVDPATGAVTVHDLRSLGADSAQVAGAIRRGERWQAGEVRRIAAAPDGAIWFTDVQRSSVSRYDPSTRTLRTFESLERATQPYGIAVTRAGHVWYSERGASRITALDPAAHERVQVEMVSARSHARHLVVDERRGRVWLPLSDTGRLGLILLQ